MWTHSTLSGSRRIFLISLLDGRIAAVDEETGRRLWVFDTGQPLVSNKGIAGQTAADKSTIFPGADGSLYAYRHDADAFEVRAGCCPWPCAWVRMCKRAYRPQLARGAHTIYTLLSIHSHCADARSPVLDHDPSPFFPLCAPDLA